jgi:hypothetical protein
MIVLSVMTGILLVAVVFIKLRDKYLDKSWKKETSDWLVGDEVYLKINDNSYELKGWSMYHIFVSKNGENTTTKYERDKLDFNKSVVWRRNYDYCKNMMNTEPNFKRGLNTDSNVSSGTVDNKPIELLTEIECQVYLKQALETEDYDLAAQIREQLKKYR